MYIMLERMKVIVWNVDMTDLSDALVNTMATTLADGGSFADRPLSRKLASNDELDDLRCTLGKAHFSRQDQAIKDPHRLVQHA